MTVRRLPRRRAMHDDETSAIARSPSRRAFCLVPLAALAACAGSRFAPRTALEGRAWDVEGRRFLDAAQARRRIAAAHVALLGETHDNRLHHEIQLSVLEEAVRAGRRPALAMEQIDIEWQPEVERAIARGASADELAQAAHVSPGWDWPLYRPLVAFALGQGLPLVALNLPNERTHAIVSHGLDALGTGEVGRLALGPAWNAARNAALRAEIVKGHCGFDTPIVDKLVDVQRAKDAVMADRILAHAERGVVAILGSGHARKDLAVPLYLAARAPRLGVLSLGLLEADPDSNDVADDSRAAPGRYDIVWFTRAAEREDPCLAFRRMPPAR